MYQNLGVQWASSIPAFLALACAPMPFLFNRFGKWLRDRSKYAQEAGRIVDHILRPQEVERETKDPAMVQAQLMAASVADGEILEHVSM